ncbi:MAG: hypothetical protein LBC39_01305 [Methanobrevibacter sp.]|jgi:hypothetical protein|nr:hypothetical protein [Candidatus Methanovirga aequatorialis]
MNKLIILVVLSFLICGLSGVSAAELHHNEVQNLPHSNNLMNDAKYNNGLIKAVKDNIEYQWHTSTYNIDCNRHIKIWFKVAGQWVLAYEYQLKDGYDWHLVLNGDWGYDPYATEVKVEWSGHQNGYFWFDGSDYSDVETMNLPGYPNNPRIYIKFWTDYTDYFFKLEREHGIKIWSY